MTDYSDTLPVLSRPPPSPDAFGDPVALSRCPLICGLSWAWGKDVMRRAGRVAAQRLNELARQALMEADTP